MPQWIHSRAEHLLAKNPDMSKATAFAVATQQSHALGKSPKGYGTAKGKRVAKRKYDTPKDDVKTPNPGGLDSPKLASTAKARALQELVEQVNRVYPSLLNYVEPTKEDDPLVAIAKEELKGAVLPKVASELIPGGKADGKKDSDFDAKQVAMGEKVEQEHSKGNRRLAREIARDHLQEIPDYYTRLKKMEEGAPKRKEASCYSHMRLELLKMAAGIPVAGPLIGGALGTGAGLLYGHASAMPEGEEKTWKDYAVPAAILGTVGAGTGAGIQLAGRGVSEALNELGITGRTVRKAAPTRGAQEGWNRAKPAGKVIDAKFRDTTGQGSPLNPADVLRPYGEKPKVRTVPANMPKTPADQMLLGAAQESDVATDVGHLHDRLDSLQERIDALRAERAAGAPPDLPVTPVTRAERAARAATKEEELIAAKDAIQEMARNGFDKYPVAEIMAAIQRFNKAKDLP